MSLECNEEAEIARLDLIIQYQTGLDTATGRTIWRHLVLAI